MKSKELYGAVCLVGITAFVSWVFSCEVLFVMGIVITLVLSSLVGLVLGTIVLSERLFPAKVEQEEEWEVRTGPSVTR